MAKMSHGSVLPSSGWLTSTKAEIHFPNYHKGIRYSERNIVSTYIEIVPSYVSPVASQSTTNLCKPHSENVCRHLHCTWQRQHEYQMVLCIHQIVCTVLAAPV